MSRKIYVAASSKEIDRAEGWMRRLTEVGFIVTSSWVDVIRRVGEANPRDATEAQCKEWAEVDADEVSESDVLWQLLPVEASGRGSYFEAGLAFGEGIAIVCSGDVKQSIFCALHDCFATDQEAFDAIVKAAL